MTEFEFPTYFYVLFWVTVSIQLCIYLILKRNGHSVNVFRNDMFKSLSTIFKIGKNTKNYFLKGLYYMLFIAYPLMILLTIFCFFKLILFK